MAKLKKSYYIIMVKHTTIALLQSLVGLMAIIANSSLQAIGLSHIRKATHNNPKIKEAERLLLISVVTQFVAAVLMVTALVLILVYRQKFQEHLNTLAYAALILAGVLLLVGGAMGSTVALRLQCYRADPHVNKAWEMATWSAVVGVLGAMMLLFIQTFVKRDSLKEIARNYLNNTTVKIPTHAPIKPAMKPKAEMPSWSPLAK